MLKMRAIYVNNRRDVVTSSIYTVPKKNGKRRAVINLRWVNSHLQTIKFKMTTMKDVKAAITKDCWMASLDLSDCFWGLPVYETDQRFLSFEWRGTTYSFRCLPFGMALSPLFITKLYRHVVQHLQARGMRAMIYIDDLLILGDSKEECAATARAAQDLLIDLGAIVNKEKSNLMPAQEAEYLGFTINSRDMKISAPTKKIINTTKAIRATLNKTRVTARHLASILGKLTSLADALFPTRVHTTGLHQQKIGLLAKGWDFPMPLSEEAKQDLQWWKDNMRTMNGRSLLPETVDVRGATDASDYGWGAWIETPQGILRWGGLFSRTLAREHINYKELLAVYYLLKSSPTPLRDKVLELGIDNTTAMWYLRKMGGNRPHLARLANKIFSILKETETHLEVFHLPGVLNHLADESSRNNSIRLWDYRLNPAIFETISHTWGPFSMDLFSTYENRQLPRFASMAPQPEAIWVDAMAHSWANEFAWAFPPANMIGRTLQKVEHEDTSMVIVTPLWPAQPWYPMLLRMMTAIPVVLPACPQLLQHPLGSPVTLSWTFVAWRISGSRCAGAATMRQSCLRRFKHGRRALTRITTPSGKPGSPSPQAEGQILQLRTTLYSLSG